MKRLIFIAILCVASLSIFAQTTNTDSVQTQSDTTKSSDWSLHQRKKNGGAFMGITFSRLDLGLATLVDNGSFTLSPQNQFLRYRSWKTSNVGFDVLQLGVKFSKTFKIYLSGGFDWTLIRLRDNITILPNQPVLTYRQDNINYSKNRFSSSYLRIPLSFDFKSKPDSRGNKFHFVLGPEGGFLLNGRVKQISTQNGKQKIDDTYHFTTFRYGAFTRIGYGDFGIFAKYYFNDMFENSPAQAGLKNFSFGIMLGF